MPRLAVALLTVLLLHGCSPPPDEESPSSDVDTQTPTNEALSAALSNTTPRPRTIVIASDPWCPHNCEAGSDREGYMVDIAREVLGEAGYTVEYVNVSWARALQLTREGQLDAVVGAFTTDAPDFVFPDTPQGRSAIALFTHPDNRWVYDGLASLHNQKLLVINGYSYTDELDQYIEEHQANPERIWVIAGPSPLDRAIYLLDQHRTDIFAEDIYVMAWWEMNNNDTVPAPRQAGLVDEIDAFVAFSPVREDAKELAKLLTEGTRQLMDSGRVQQILDQYGLSLWTEMP
ncbi:MULTISPECIES: substrate-binding periplasmic protein [Marinobacter]|uniref:ABC transporter substrate-binding protein n=2 Tax=Marinobacter salarius TaxID=1420917 RepID=W5YN12_9GAMM|nr:MULTISPECIES: transporter substrate-binding domain-containing protein [Marinobacter]AHI30617.1 ABC transporter substrate-binding protein [Marinobacter salarius]KXJ46606.1 MAG: ABC transporter substrate-binding protein [Marinobacter sp. Hex_13]MCC4283486.1 transporter substrate-binding domain-containing protein [Marinobacter salarius]MCZ4283837.1 transporter substrate-binding domain-containing protein [Marinobacter salarius]MDM8180529.1 transporter substrate-binding domain-containing protein